MPLPRSSSDLRLQVPCVICSGNATFGSDNHSRPTRCHDCDGTGWQDGEFNKLSAAQLAKLRALLPALPLDPAIPYLDAEPMIQLSKLLTKRWIETISFPHGNATEIDLIDKQGNTIRLHAIMEKGTFHHLNAIPATPAP
jgi:endogenous inhibitor of DNA gyrase (YacG/DUF329 family)